MDERYYSLDPDVDPQPYQVARSLMIEDRAVWTSIILKILCFEVIHCVNTKSDFSWVQRFWSHSALNWLNEICIVSHQRLPLEVLELKVEKQNKIKTQPTHQQTNTRAVSTPRAQVPLSHLPRFLSPSHNTWASGLDRHTAISNLVIGKVYFFANLKDQHL